MDGVNTSKRRGRPALVEGEKAESVAVRMPASLHDRVSREAIRKGVSVSAVARAAIAQVLARPAQATTAPE
jgi:predicted HicB family RNase H-like nuclease